MRILLLHGVGIKFDFKVAKFLLLIFLSAKMAFDCELEPVVKFSFWHGVPGGPDPSGAGKADIFHDITFLIIAFNDFPKTYKWNDLH